MLAVIGLYFFGYYQPSVTTISNEVRTNVNQIANETIKQVASNSRPIITIPTSGENNQQQINQQSPIGLQNSPETSQSLDQLRLVALNDINRYRQEVGANILPMDNAKTTQAWAEHLLSEGCIAHREGNSGPMQRYVDNGDPLQMVYENVAGGYGTSWMNPIDAIKQADNDMMNNDADSNNAHKDNILNPNHISVSIGIAYNGDKLILVQDFQEPIQPNWKNFDMSYDDGKSCW